MQGGDSRGRGPAVGRSSDTAAPRPPGPPPSSLQGLGCWGTSGSEDRLASGRSPGVLTLEGSPVKTAISLSPQSPRTIPRGCSWPFRLPFPCGGSHWPGTSRRGQKVLYAQLRLREASLEPEGTQHERQNWGLSQGLGLQSLDPSGEKEGHELRKGQSLLPAWSTEAWPGNSPEGPTYLPPQSPSF